MCFKLFYFGAVDWHRGTLTWFCKKSTFPGFYFHWQFSSPADLQGVGWTEKKIKKLNRLFSFSIPECLLLSTFRVKPKDDDWWSEIKPLFWGNRWRTGRQQEAEGLMVVTCEGHISGENQQRKENGTKNKHMWHYCILYCCQVTAWIQANADDILTLIYTLWVWA